jgi:hypothetical protein
MITRPDALNDALERLDGYGYLDAPGFASHGPMGAETLSTLGHDELVGSWVDTYKARHQALDVPPSTDRIDAHEEAGWRSALGDMSRVSDWAELFRRELAEQPWPAVLQRWLPRLLAGYGGALTHGLIRVAHGVRALPAEAPPSGLLLGELAKGLAFWAASFTPLPGRPGLHGRLALADALARLPRPDEPWSPIEAGTFARMGELHRFPPAAEALGRPASIDGALSDLTAAFCQAVLAASGPTANALVHTVTPTAAARTLQPYMSEVSVETAYAQLWHVSAAIVCGFAPPMASAGTTGEPDLETPDRTEILARAVEHRDTHVLKFAEACAREDALRPDPVYMRAAQHVLRQLPAW